MRNCMFNVNVVIINLYDGGQKQFFYRFYRQYENGNNEEDDAFN